MTALPEATQRKPEWELAIGLLLSAAENGGIVMMARIAVTQALTGRKVAMPELRFVDGAVFLGPLKGRANAAAVLILRDITRRSPKRDCATPARGECQRLTVSHVNGQHAHGLRASDRRIA